jgi:hypothetical protein
MSAAGATRSAIDIVFDGLQAPIRARGPAEAMATIELLFDGWPWRTGADDVGIGGTGVDGGPDLRIEPADGAYRVDVPGLDPQPAANVAEAVHMLVGSLVAHLTHGRAGLVSFHAASFQSRAGVVICVGPSFAGKSSLGLHAAAQGARFFGDDRIIVELGATPHAVSQGLTPKLRLPIPADAGEDFHRFVATHAVREAQGLVWLALGPAAAASFGESRKVAGVVLLDRRDGAETALALATRADTTQALLRHSFAPGVPVSALVARLAALAGAVPSDRITYSSSRDAARQLLARHGGPA